MLHADKDGNKQSMVTEKKYSTANKEINQGFDAAMGMLISPGERDEIEFQK
jgi:hypothetical protein